MCLNKVSPVPSYSWVNWDTIRPSDLCTNPSWVTADSRGVKGLSPSSTCSTYCSVFSDTGSQSGLMTDISSSKHYWGKIKQKKPHGFFSVIKVAPSCDGINLQRPRFPTETWHQIEQDIPLQVITNPFQQRVKNEDVSSAEMVLLSLSVRLQARDKMQGTVQGQHHPHMPWRGDDWSAASFHSKSNTPPAPPQVSHASP